MTALYPEMAVDREAVIETVHGLQVDLTLLADWLAREPEPIMHRAALQDLALMRWNLERLTPCLRRH